MSFTPNPEQLRAIEWGESDLAISAGAGSGKTAVLSLRVVRAVTDGIGEQGPLDLSSVVAITFTKKAAGELAERVRRELVSAGRSEDARRVDEAWISTIDGLCGRILRRYALDMGVDPRYRTASTVDAGILSGQVFEALGASAYADGGVLADLFDQYEPDVLREAIHAAYGRVQAMGATVGQIEVAEAEMSVDEAMAGCASSLDGLLAAIGEAGGSGASREANRASAEASRLLLVSTAGLEGLNRAKVLRDGLMGIKFNARVEAELVKQVRSDVEKVLMAASSVLIRPLADAFLELLGRYESAYSEAKRDIGVLDYSDVVTHVARLLAEDQEVAESLKAEFGLIMVDEFQDTNELRLKAIEPLSRNDLCIVGDDKQSIYRFQFADVEVFRRLRERIGETVELDQNYRSKPEILEFVNHVFGSPEFFSSDLLKLRAARKGADQVAWPKSGPRVEVLEVECNEEWTDGARCAEAVAAAGRAAELVTQGIDPGDIVILLSGMTRAGEYASALRERGIEVQVASGESLSDSVAVMHVRAFLRVMVLPSDDKAMIEVLAGPLFGLSPDGLVALHRHGGDGFFTAASETGKGTILPGLSAEDTQVLDRFGRVYAEITSRAVHEPVSVVIQELCELTEYDLVLAAKGSEGEHDWAQVLRLKRLASQWQETGYGGVGGFIEHLSAMERYGEKEPAGPAASVGGAVRIMSIHASKGLQFPVVIVGRLGSDLVLSRSGDIVLERVDGRPTLAMVPPKTAESGVGTRVTAVQHVRDTVKELERAEALRLLYVAFTRAEDALILVGASVRNKKGLSTEKGLGLVLTALGGPEPGTVICGAAEVKIGLITTDEMEIISVPSAEARENEFGIGEAAAALGVTERRCRAQEPSAKGWRPDSVSYSSLQEYDDCPFRFYADRVLGLRRLRAVSDEGTRATEVGSAVHEVLEHLSEMSPETLIRDAIDRHRLSDEGATRLRTAISSFSTSDFASRLGNADTVAREARITVSLGETDLVGSIDAVAWEGDRALVVDYKTGEDQRLSRSDERIEHYRLQSQCYALAAFAAGAQRVEAHFIFLEQGAQSVSFDFQQAQEADIRASIERRIELMADGVFPPLKVYDARRCEACPAFGSPCSMKRPRS